MLALLSIDAADGSKTDEIRFALRGTACACVAVGSQARCISKCTLSMHAHVHRPPSICDHTAGHSGGLTTLPTMTSRSIGVTISCLGSASTRSRFSSSVIQERRESTSGSSLSHSTQVPESGLAEWAMDVKHLPACAASSSGNVRGTGSSSCSHSQ